MKNRYWIVIFAVIILLCVVFLLFNGNGSSNVVGIYQDGVLLHKINLSDVNEPYELIVEYNGSKNTIFVERDDIKVTEAECPDHVCVEHGSLGNRTPIVCLPNRLVIQWIEDNGELDAVI